MHRASLASRFQILLIAVLGTAGPLSAQQGGDDPILFPFDFIQGENFNPTFQEPDMTVSFLTNTAVHPEGGIRLHEGPASSPHSGPGHLTLSAPLPPPRRHFQESCRLHLRTDFSVAATRTRTALQI